MSENVSPEWRFVRVVALVFQEKIAKLHERRLKEGLDLNRNIQNRVDFRNPRFVSSKYFVKIYINSTTVFFQHKTEISVIVTLNNDNSNCRRQNRWNNTGDSVQVFLISVQ